MVVVQVALAFAGSLAPTLATRPLEGCGDGAMFVSLVQLITDWFPGRRNP